MSAANWVATPPADGSAPKFFLDWALWEKMTFVLALAIAATFVAGLCKLWWNIRYTKKHALLDEEKQLRISEMRQRGVHVVTTNPANNVPFGVRALESGLEVDGIHVERNSLRAERNSSRSSGSFASSISPSSLQSLASAGVTAAPPNTRINPRGNVIYSSHVRNVSSGQIAPSTGQGTPGPHTAYKPRRSSQLRFSSYGYTQYDEATLEQLEGRPPATSPIPRTHRPRGTPARAVTVDSSSETGADNERNSGTSDESDSTLTAKKHAKGKSTVTFQLDEPESGEGSYRNMSYTPTNARMELPSMQRYSAVSTISPEEFEKFNLFEEPAMAAPSFAERSRAERPSNVPGHYASSSMGPNSSSVDEADYVITPDVPLLFIPRFDTGSPEPTYGAGTLHVNKKNRKANEGFEVLPAGTFGVPNEFKAGEAVVETEGRPQMKSNFGLKRTSNRISKERPASLSGRRLSRTERI